MKSKLQRTANFKEVNGKSLITMAEKKRKVFQNADEQDKCIADFISGVDSGEIDIDEIEFVVDDLQFSLESLENIYHKIEMGVKRRMDELYKEEQKGGVDWWRTPVQVNYSFKNDKDQYADSDLFSIKSDKQIDQGLLNMGRSTYYDFKRKILPKTQKYFTAIEVEAMIRLYKLGDKSKWNSHEFKSIVNDIVTKG